MIMNLGLKIGEGLKAHNLIRNLSKVVEGFINN